MVDYRFNSSNELGARNLNLKHTIESGQPLTFLANYDWKKGRFSYVDKSGKVLFSYGKSPEGTTVQIRMGRPDSSTDLQSASALMRT